MYAFAARPKWIVMHVVVLLVVTLFLVAGLWQLHRLDERRRANAVVRERRAMPPVTEVTRGVVHRRARLVGTYDYSEEVVLTGRGTKTNAGNHILTPLVIGDEAIIVDRGWVPVGREEGDEPRGRVRVEGILIPSEGRGPFGSDSGDREVRSVARIDVSRLARQLPYRTEPLYLLLASQRPRVDLPRPVDPAPLSEGSHRIYAVQWFSFAPIALIAYGAILRREARKRT